MLADNHVHVRSRKRRNTVRPYQSQPEPQQPQKRGDVWNAVYFILFTIAAVGAFIYLISTASRTWQLDTLEGVCLCLAAIIAVLKRDGVRTIATIIPATMWLLTLIIYTLSH